MSAAMSRPTGAVAGAGTTGTCMPCAPRRVETSWLAWGGGVLGLTYPQLSPQPSLLSSSCAGPPKMRSNWLGDRGFCLVGGALREAGRRPSQAAVAEESNT
jgi:hypothetical protein